jgi:cytochrome P450
MLAETAEFLPLLNRRAVLAMSQMRRLEMSQIKTAIAIAPVLILAIILVRKMYQRISENLKARASGCHPPRNQVALKDPIFGLDYMMQTLKAGASGQYLVFMAQRFQGLGNTFVTRRFLYDSVHTIDPDNVKAILSTDFHSWKIGDLRASAFQPLFGQGIFASNGQRWAHARALIRPSFTKTNMQPLLHMLERHFQALLRCVPADGTTSFDLQNLFILLTIDAATEFLMGQSVHSLEARAAGQSDVPFASDYTFCCLDTVRRLQMGPLSMFVPFRLDKNRVAARDRAWAYVDRFVVEALELRRTGKLDHPSADSANDDGAPEYNFLREAARDTDDPVELRTQVLNILLASSDTTSALLSNFFWELSRHPEVFARLKSEIQETLRGELPTDVQLKNMVYLRWCINECKLACYFQTSFFFFFFFQFTNC